MATKHDPADEPFFREWQRRRPDEHRSLERAAQLKALLALDKISVPVLTVVGSKGKGTIATYASATLAATGLRVGTLTSPSMLSNRERIRVDGSAISSAEYAELAAQLSAVLSSLGDRTPGSGYLAPTGLFTLAAVRHFTDSKCDIIVLEAGMGGRSDEVSLFSPCILAIGPIFAEHIGILGANTSEIAREKCGAASNETRWVLSAPQTPDVSSVLEQMVGPRLIFPHTQRVKTTIPHGISLPPGFSEANARLGIEAALKLVEAMKMDPPRFFDLQRVLASVRAHGRLSVHFVGDTKWVVDAAIDERGVAMAIDWCRKNIGTPDTVFVSFPDSKDVAGAQRALAGLDYVPVAVEAPHLKYSAQMWPKPLVKFEEVKKLAKGDCVLLIGTMSFVALVLEVIGVDLDILYEPPH